MKAEVKHPVNVPVVVTMTLEEAKAILKGLGEQPNHGALYSLFYTLDDIVNEGARKSTYPHEES